MTDQKDIPKAQALLKQLANLEALAATPAADIKKLNIEGVIDNPNSDAPARLDVSPTDSQWNAILNQLNQVISARITSVKADLAALGITGV